MRAVPSPLACCLALASTCALVQPGSVVADEVLLKGGGRVTGVVVERSERSVVLDTGPGRVTLPLSRVERIVKGPSPLETYRKRSERLAPADTRGWLELGLWAQEQGLLTQAREAFERVASLDPGNAVAQAALGNILLDGRWVSQQEAFRARGYVLFEGRWVSPAEREELLAEQSARIDAARAQQERAEAEARAREAEARARTAEAEARRADADARAAENGGIPLWGSFGTGFVGSPTVFAVCPVCGHRHRPGFCTGVAAPPRRAPMTHPVATPPAGAMSNPPCSRMRPGSTCGAKLAPQH